MAYKLCVENTTYPVQVVQTPTEIWLTHKPVRETISFISPVRLMIGQTCGLSNDSVDFQFRVESCLGFSFSSKFYVSGILNSKSEAVPN